MNVSDYSVNSSQSGVHQGFLWNFSSPVDPQASMHVLCSERHPWTKMLRTNPLFKKIFDNAEILYLEHPPIEPTKIFEILRRWTPSPELNLLRSELKELALQYLSKAKLSPYVRQIYDSYQATDGRTLDDDVRVYTFIVLLHIVLAQGDLQEEDLFQPAMVSSKEVRYLLTEDEYLEILRVLFGLSINLLLNQRLGLVCLMYAFKDERLMDHIMRHFSLKYHAWLQGDVKSHEEPPFDLSELLRLLDGDMSSFCGPDLKTLLQSLDGTEQQSKETLLKRISEKVKPKDHALVVLDFLFASQVHRISTAYEKVQLEMQQIMIPMKPVGFFWTLKNQKGQKAYLLGTIHIAPKELLNFNSKILRCFAKSQAIGVEADITRGECIEAWHRHPYEVREEAKERECFESQDIHLIHLRKKIISVLKMLATKRGMTEAPNAHSSEYEQYAFYRDWIGKAIKAEIGCESGMELELISKAKQAGKPVCDLETYEEHLRVLDIASASAKEEPIDKLLIQKLVEVDDLTETQAEELFDAYKRLLRGGIDRWARTVTHGYHQILMNSLLEIPEKEKAYFDQRNVAMADKIDSLVNVYPSRRFFFMVGALHAPGENGMLKLLESKGYTSRRVIVHEPV